MSGSADSAKEQDDFAKRNSWITHSNRWFVASFVLIGSTYLVLILGMLLADVAYALEQSISKAKRGDSFWVSMVSDNPISVSLRDPKIQYSIWLSMISCTLSAILSVLFAVPLGYVLSRIPFRGRDLVDSLLDIPIVLPPLIVGLSLLILFQFAPFSWVARSIVYQVPAVVLAQWAVSCAYAVRTMKMTFDQIDPRCEQVAISLGCTRFQAFSLVTFPEAKLGLLTAFTLAWARSLGEFGPLLIFAGATRMKTEVLSTSVFLEMNVGNIEGAVAVSLLMIFVSIVVMIITRWASTRQADERAYRQP
jgi:molybdate transport system permease protein